MYRVIACLTLEHDFTQVMLAAMVCIIGSGLTVVLARRMINASHLRKQVQLGLTSLMAGATVWSTHFIAMLAYEPGYDHAYEPVLTAVSLAVAVVGMLIANLILAYGAKAHLSGLAGAVFGLTVSIMHFVGMAAYQLPGDIEWRIGPLVASVVLGISLGALAFHRIARPFTRLCWLGGTILMALAICMMHFTGMSAIDVVLNPLIVVPERAISDNAMSIAILSVMTIILLMGFASIGIEVNLENETRALLRHYASHDALTGLSNRVGLNHRIDETAQRLESDGTLHVATLIIDLKLFKEVNDLHGHAVGDHVLKTIAGRLMHALDDDEFIARTGGDEFFAIKLGFRRVDQVTAFAERLQGALIEPVDIETETITIGGAIGVATSLVNGRDLNDLQQKSVLALYRAKSDPDRSICIYSAEIDQTSQDRLRLTQDLRNACDNGELELDYQLQNDLVSLQPTGFEALLRWNHPTRGRVSPVVFIPIAEQTGLIREIGLWVLRTACQEAATWPDHLSVAVNVAPQQLVQPSFIENVAEILKQSGLNAARLEIEVTEASIIDDQAHTLAVMGRLKSMGVRIAMDDFGTGYSSLATLQAFPFDKIKIDRSFISDVHANNHRAAIVRATLLIGDALDIPVLAEGVETDDELAFLKSEHCASVQGFYFGKPMNRDGVHQVIANLMKRSA